MIAVFSMPAMGHLKPMLPVLSGLVANGERVVCYGHTAFASLIAQSGAEFRPYPDIGYDIEAPDFNLVRMAADLINASEVLYPALLQDIRELAPRLIVQDSMALWASRIGTTLSIARIHTIPTIVFNAEVEARMWKEDGVFKRATDLALGLPPLIKAMVSSRFAVGVRESFGIERAWRKLAPPVAEIVFLPEALQIGATQADVPRHYIGPTVAQTHRQEPIPVREGYALITFGTLSNTETARFAAAMRGAFRAGLSVVALCGRKVDVARLRHVAAMLEQEFPNQFAYILEFVPDMESLMKGARIVIHHAGMATSWEAIRFRKPALFIPTICDQKVLASQLMDVGLGIRLPPGRECDADAIADGVQAVGALQTDWSRIETILEKAGGAAEGVRVIQQVLGQLA